MKIELMSKFYENKFARKYDVVNYDFLLWI